MNWQTIAVWLVVGCVLIWFAARRVLRRKPGRKESGHNSPDRKDSGGPGDKPPYCG